MTNLLEVLYEALNSPIGVVVETEDVERLRQKLYAARKDYEDLQCLSLIVSPLIPNQLWIVKRNENPRD